MVPYKRLDYAIRTFARNGRRLKVVGDGPELSALRKLAAPNIEFCGRVTDQNCGTCMPGRPRSLCPAKRISE